MKKVAVFILSFVLAASLTSAVKTNKSKINWMSLDELKATYAKQPRPIIIDVYTQWCGWCKVMDKDTYDNDNVAAYINSTYYAVKFDAESTEAVEWASKKYAYNPRGKVHDLAVYLLGGQMGYPTTVLFSSIDAQPAPIPGYMKPADLEAPLKYFGDGNYKKENFPVFMNKFTASW